MSFQCDDCGKNMGGTVDYQNFAHESLHENELRHFCTDCWLKTRSCSICKQPVEHLKQHRNSYRETLDGSNVVYTHAHCAKGVAEPDDELAEARRYVLQEALEAVDRAK